MIQCILCKALHSMHCLISEGGFSDDSFWRHISHFSYTFLRNAFRTALLDEMESIIGPSFKKIKASCYKEHKHGFYVYAKPNKCDPETVTKYIGRYLGRPVIATSRIDKYDGSMVTFHYNRHEDDKYVTETIPAIYAAQSVRINTVSIGVLINGALLYCPPLAMIPYNVQNVNTKWIL